MDEIKASIMDTLEDKRTMEALRKINPQELSQDKPLCLDDEGILWQLETTLREMRVSRPDEKSEQSRRYAVTITEMEKVVAYFKTFIINGK